ncbi:MAG: gamma-glutamyl-gamma-aminobutyrate hydrolase family protein [Deltaproteobacteria bacterium]|jgi:putative glutamine amidotransferase|nr:gamma-glutamyl-gamma-aminobutyrate hydrolase family protein [Deltaproteobacteria bacterium]
MTGGKLPAIAVSASQRDAFDWNKGRLAQVRTSFQYCDAVYRAGGLPLVLANWTGEGRSFTEGRGRAQSSPRRVEPLLEKAGAVMDRTDGLMLTGGGDVIMDDEDGFDVIREMDRDRDFWEAALFQAAMDRGKPILGICRGLQLMNVHLGGDLWDDIPSDYPNPLKHQQRTPRSQTSHRVVLEPDSLLASICGRTEHEVNSGHHQAVRRVADGLKIAGRSPDDLIEVLEYPGYPWAIAVQWHPEALADHDDCARALFEAFIAAC